MKITTDVIFRRGTPGIETIFEASTNMRIRKVLEVLSVGAQKPIMSTDTAPQKH
jgi:hypothetical protein